MGNRKLIQIYFFMMSISTLLAQTAPIDSLRRALTHSREDTNRVLILQEIAYIYALKRSDSTLIYANQGIQLSNKLNYPKGEALGFIKMAIYYRLKKLSAQGMQYALKALPVFEKQHDNANIILCNLLIGWTLEDQEYPRLAVGYVLKVTPIAEQTQSEWLHYCYSTLCKNYNTLNVLDSALVFGLKAETLVPNDIYNLSEIGDIYLKMPKIEEAQRYYDKALNKINVSSSKNYIAHVLNSLSTLYYQKEQPDSAIFFAKKAIEIEKGNYSLLNTSATLLTKYYKKKGLNDSMFVYMQFAFATQDSLNKQEKEKLLSILYNEQLHQQQVQSHQQQYEKQLQIFFLLAALLVFSLIAYIFYRHNKQKQKEALFNQRLRIAGDMHDDLGSDLSALNIRASIIRQKVKSGKQPLSEIDSLVDSTREISKKVREMIWTINVQHDNLSDIINYFDTYADDVFESTNINVHTSLPPNIPKLALNGEKRKALLMCFKETLNNVLKHAHASEVNIAYTIENQIFTISIQDNGVGFDPVLLLQGTANGNGLMNMPIRMVGIGGQCHIETSPQGTLVIFSLPI